MRLERLFIGTYSGKLSGSIEFTNELGKIELRLDEKAAADILRVCADSLTRMSKKAADEMTAKVIEAILPLQVEAPND